MWAWRSSEAWTFLVDLGSLGEQNYIREGRSALKVLVSLLLGTVAIPSPDSCLLLTLNEKEIYNPFHLGDDVVWLQELFTAGPAGPTKNYFFKAWKG